MDVRQVAPNTACPSGYEVVINGGRKAMGLDAIQWAKEGCALGAGEIVVNSIDADGTKEGYEINLTRWISEAVSVPVVASGGAGTPAHLAEVLTEGKADAALVASMVHYGHFTISEIKAYLTEQGVKVRTLY
jgi:cyclase